MQLTKEEAIKRHRLMWKWIADETLSKKKCTDKLDAFKHFGWRRIIENDCWCCEYDKKYHDNCSACPIKWPSKTIGKPCIDFCFGRGLGIYDIWSRATENNDWRKAAYYALLISMLPENPDA